jgi:L-ascorbate metabolism protein UlaG (beta-lactamase superfamily)
MKITKYAQSCLLVEVKGVKILTDVGSYSMAVPEVTGLSAVLITHEHQDHFDLPKLQEVLTRNPEVKVITHAGAGEKLTEEGIAWTAIEPGETVDVSGISIESFGTEHAIIYGTSPCRNTGFLIAGKLYMPGDALHDVPNKQVEILALPTGGPWHKISTAIDYAKTINPRVAFPIHDAMYTDDYKQTSIPRWIGGQLEAVGISFTNLAEGESAVF